MISLAEIAKALDCDFYGNGKLIFSSPSEPLSANINQIAIAIDQKFQPQLFNTKAKSLSFSITYSFFGFFLSIKEVRFPVPGPTSRTILSSIGTILAILSKIFLSTRKFWPKLFLALINFYPRI